ncbi:hypothetical protein GCM10010504_23270 [Streptomyces griseus]|nr:hypothetical protein GCM10010504_23270 [Streptomyces griseus]
MEHSSGSTGNGRPGVCPWKVYGGIADQSADAERPRVVELRDAGPLGGRRAPAVVSAAARYRALLARQSAHETFHAP